MDDVDILLTLPDHLRKTLLAVCRFGLVTAGDVAQHTGRARAVESSHLNELVRMGYLKRMRKTRKVLFYSNGFTVKRRGKLNELLERINQLPEEQQTLLAEDLFTAIMNRLSVFERLNLKRG
jgi:DNA-binding transcriptional ArsR family regulator